jgi:hypothetical protein
MSIVYNTATINARLAAVVSNIDAGAGNGVIRLTDSGGSILSTITLAKPSGTAAGGVLTFSGLPLVDPSAAGTGNAALARIEDSTGVVVVSGMTVGVATGDIIITNGIGTTAITAGQSIGLLSAVITGN